MRRSYPQRIPSRIGSHFYKTAEDGFPLSFFGVFLTEERGKSRSKRDRYSAGLRARRLIVVVSMELYACARTNIKNEKQKKKTLPLKMAAKKN